jgi:hypothetical protein
MSFQLHIRLRLGWRDRRCNRCHLHRRSLHQLRRFLRFYITILPRSTWLRPKQRFNLTIWRSSLHNCLRHLLIR